MKTRSIMAALCLMFITTLVINAAESTSSSKKILVALLDFKAVRVEDSLVDAIEENLATNLIMSQAFIFIERSQLDKVLNELNLANSDEFDEDTAREVGNMLGVELVFIGSVTEIAGITTINVRAIEVESGRARFAYKVEAGEQKEILRRIEELAQTMASSQGDSSETDAVTKKRSPSFSFNKTLTPMGKAGIGTAAGGGGALLIGLGLFIFDYVALNPDDNKLGIAVSDYSTYKSLYYADIAMLATSITLMALGAIAVGIGIPLLFIGQKEVSLIFETGRVTRIGFSFRL
jgi:TolB-like protein